LYEAEASQHSLQKQMGEMEDELLHLRSIVEGQMSYAFPARDQRQAFNDARRSSFASQRSDSISHGFLSSQIDEALPPSIRHQRQVSLAMLQARIISEAQSSGFHSHGHKSVASTEVTSSPRLHSSLHTLHEGSSRDSIDVARQVRRPQFLDESHVFWCASCKGDLIVL